MTATGIGSDDTRVFPRFLDLAAPSIERGDGVWLTTTDGHRILDACSGGAMVACLGYGVPEIVAAAAEQAERLSYFYNHHFTSEPQERLADRLLEVAAPAMARVRLVSGGSEANETALATRPAVSRRARGDRALAGDLPGAVVPRVDDGNPRAQRSPRAPGAVHAVPRVTPAHPALDVAVRPDRRGGPRGARPAPRGDRTGDRGRVLLRAGERRRPARLLAAGSLLGRPRGTAGAARVPDLFRRGRDRDRPRRELAGRGSAADRARHRRDREGSRGGLRAARCSPVP